jgi:uncharacterized membrane protein YidH (DUF202 family)
MRDKTILAALIILLATAIVIIGILSDWVDTGFFVGPLRFSHWMALIGFAFVAVYTPMFYFLKRRYPTKIKTLLNIHVFGFLLAFMLVSIHFAGQISRPPQFYPELGEGIALYLAMVVLVVTGFLHRFQIIPKKAREYYSPHFNRFLHVSTITAFYIIIIIHVLINI